MRCRARAPHRTATKPNLRAIERAPRAKDAFEVELGAEKIGLAAFLATAIFYFIKKRGIKKRGAVRRYHRPTNFGRPGTDGRRRGSPHLVHLIEMGFPLSSI
jgi:hypothetical protein